MWDRWQRGEPLYFKLEQAEYILSCSDMTKHHLIAPPGERARPLNIAGFAITVLASGAQTGGYEIFHQVGPEGTGPGPHSHL